MANISDNIEKFILDALACENCLQLSRNELASFFGCAPSQINYVLNTRFTLNRGFDVVSRRGGSGYIELVRIDKGDDWTSQLLDEVLCEPVDFVTAKQIVAGLVESGVWTSHLGDIMQVVLSDKSLANPVGLASQLRTQILRQIIVAELKEKERED